MVDIEDIPVCPDCEVRAADYGIIEINMSSWDVHDGDIVNRWRCPECCEEWTTPVNDEELEDEL